MSSGSLLSSASSSPCGIEKGLWLKSTFFASSSYSYIGKSTIQQKWKRVLLDQAELLADAGARGAGELGRLRLLAGGEEDAVVGAEAERLDQLRGSPPRRDSWRSGRRARRPCWVM